MADSYESLKIPPHSIEAEQSVLGGLLLSGLANDSTAWDTIADKIIESDFYRQDHRLIFRAIADLVEDSKPLDLVTVSEWLKQRNELENAGGFAYLATMAKDTPSAANIRAYADIVREKSVLRQLISVGTGIADSAFTAQGRPSKELLDEAEQKVFKIAEQGTRQGQVFKPLKSLLKVTLAHIEELSKLDTNITGVSTGYSQLDEMTSGLQKGDLIIVAGRPSMGKCIVTGSRVLDPLTGRLEVIDDLVARQQGSLATLNAQMRLQVAQPSQYVDDGIKPVFRVRTALGREITTTLTHPFLTIEGWKPLADIQVGKRIAVPRILPFFGKGTLSEQRTKLIAYFLTDGGLTQSCPQFTNINPRIRQDFIAALDDFPGVQWRLEDSKGQRTPSIRVATDTVFQHEARQDFAARFKHRLQELSLTLNALARQLGVAVATVHYWSVGKAVPAGDMFGILCRELQLEPSALMPHGSAATTRSAPNPVTEWLQTLDLMGKNAYEKRIPAPVYELPRALMAVFLNRAFACDGSVYVQNGVQAGISYSTVSYALARDMQHLLVRFGILAKLRHRQVRYQGEYRAAYELRITHQQHVRQFLEEIGVYGKEEAVQKALTVSQEKTPKVILDTLPSETWAIVADCKSDLTWAELAHRMGRKPGHNFHVGKRGIGRELLAEMAAALSSETLATLAHSDLYWDEIESIDYLGEQQVYDLSVPDTHNFVADDVLVHNTTFSMNIAEYAAAHKKLPTAVFSMEMPAEQLTLRLLSSMGRVDQHRIRTGKLTDEDWPRIATAVKIFADVPMFIDDSPALSPTEVRARARRLMREHGQLGLIVLDYLQLMQTGTSTDNRTAEISEISRGLKSLAKELAVPVIALSQLNRSLEQRPNKRPVMSDLRECVTGDTLVMLADGQRVPIRDLVGQTPSVVSVNAAGQLETAVTDLVWSVGKKETVRVSFASGRTICCSKEHRLRALWDWQYAGELQPGDRIALAHHLPEPAQPQPWPEHEIILLAHLVGDGSYIKHQPLRYTTACEANSQAVTQAAEALGSTVTRHPGKGNWHQLVISGNGNRWHPQGVGKWLKDLGIFGQRSREKHLPAGVFQLPNAQLALFLRHLWATDGSIHVGKTKCRIYFATASELLIRDVAALLLRFGIVARIKHITTAESIEGWFTADVSGVTQQRLFMREIGAFGSRADNSDELMRLLNSTVDNTNVDTLPESVFDYVRAQMQQQGITHRRMASLRGTAYGGNAHFNFAPSRDTLSSYAEILNDDALRTLVSDGLFWDRVVAVEPAGEAEVFDLTVPGNACWLADGIVSHNSGAIEQDADLIIFIYRDEVYNPESPDKGTAEIIIAKQRNGPIGSLRLTFLGKYTRFENYTPDIYTPGFE
ncbi:replicative DNA helicase [Thiothrix subterranea]|uniref:Replicative DNA helicase n=1 Tax=Thiothrix subterranea TaxID=2735563 RepID=A0AA51MIU6_9GAMM|nr:replicative DNA helicase [Thiothrix subterranea]MDQ5767978.1 replicative DNA helicase [Thiothrix subterranea]WML85257.1 replicative DNA helicase [Thiothrix subterranea]